VSSRAVVLFFGVVLLLAAWVGAATAFSASAGAAPSVVTTITVPGWQPSAVGVCASVDKVYVADLASGDLVVVDGATNRVFARIAVGRGVSDVVVNETYAKVYVASDVEEGNGLVSIVDARTDRLIKQFSPGEQGNVSFFTVEGDNVHDQVYVGFYGGTGVIDAATDGYEVIPAAAIAPDAMAVNTATNTLYQVVYAEGAFAVDGATHAVKLLETLGGGYLDVAVGERENKVYLTAVDVPGQATMGIIIYDADTGVSHAVGSDDLEPLVFNERTNQLFAGVQVGERGAIVDGVTNRLRSFNLDALEAAGVGAIGLRHATNNAYMASVFGPTVP
jgi:YVTN family beta-propeller protein